MPVVWNIAYAILAELVNEYCC